MKRLYVSDLDGTLLRPDARLSPPSRDQLLRLLDEGVPFTIATARSVVSMRTILAGVPLQLPVIATNGAYVADLERGDLLAVHTLDDDVAHAAIGFARAARLGPFLSTRGDRDGGMLYERCENDGMGWYIREREEARDPRLARVDDVSAHVDAGAICVTLMGREEPIRAATAALQRRFGERCTLHAFHNWYSPDWWWLTVHGRDANKGHALRVLVERCGLADHQVVVFGDTEGDLPLFDAAHVSIAVENAEPPVRAAADHVIGRGEDDSVMRFVTRDVLRRRRTAVTRETHAVAASGGARLAVDVHRPAGVSTGAVIVTHGFASSRRRGKAEMLGAELAAAGLTVLAPDLQGHGDSEGPFAELTIGRSVADVRAVASLPEFADAPRRALIGSSFGGLVSAWAAAEDSGLCDRLVLIAPALGFLARYLDGLDPSALALWRGGTPHRVVTPFFDVALGTEILDEAPSRPLDDVHRRLLTPTLVLHGTEDASVPHGVSRAFVAAPGPAPRRLRSFPGGDHSLGEHHDAIAESILTFLS